MWQKRRSNPIKQVSLKRTAFYSCFLTLHNVIAAALVDKNSRTIVKILQLLELSQKPDASKIDPEGLVHLRVEKLKARLCRRLVKLAKWSDIPESERQPSLASSKGKDNRGENKYPYSGVGMGTVIVVPAPVMSKRVDCDKAAAKEVEGEEGVKEEVAKEEAGKVGGAMDIE